MEDKSVKLKTEKNYISGIRCDVQNCVYNDKNSNCFAEEIKVGPNFASSSVDTECATFKHD